MTAPPGADGAALAANQFVDFGGLTNADPGATRVPGPSVPVVVAFARGLDNALWYAQSALPPGGAVHWHSLGGRLASGVTAATTPGRQVYVFALGGDNQVWMRSGVWPNLDGWTPL